MYLKYNKREALKLAFSSETESFIDGKLANK